MTVRSPQPRLLGAIIAGGRSVRYGSAKALARVGGIRVIDRVSAALRNALDHDEIIAIINDAELAAGVTLPSRADVRPGMGALGGLHAALLWAAERGAGAVLAAGCDMPFLSVPLLRELAMQADSADVIVPESAGPRGIEPLCACYSVSCTAAIEAALDDGDARMIGFHRDVRVTRIPMARVRTHGDPAFMFMNLNTPADRARADSHAEHAE